MTKRPPTCLARLAIADAFYGLGRLSSATATVTGYQRVLGPPSLADCRGRQTAAVSASPAALGAASARRFAAATHSRSRGEC
jgi:hypothetical protein